MFVGFDEENDPLPGSYGAVPVCMIDSQLNLHSAMHATWKLNY